MAVPNHYSRAQWLQSFLHPVVLETRSSERNPHLEIALHNGRLLLHAGQANYSYGELQRAFADCFAEVGVYQRKPATVLVLGWGGGSVGALLQQQLPTTALTGVEADEVVVELYDSYFMHRFTKRPQIHINEVLVYLRQDCNQYDLLVVDVFQELHAPAHLDSQVMLEELRRATLPGGLLIWNRLLYPPQARAQTEAFHPLAEACLPSLRHYDTLHNRFWIWENTLPHRQ